MAYKDPEKAREYDRLRKQKKRTEEKLGKLRDKPSGRKVEREVTAELRREIKTTVLDASDIHLADFDQVLLRFGNKALELAAQGLDHIAPETLEPIDIKRLAEVGVALRNVAAQALEKREAMTVTESMILHERVLSDPEALDHVHALLAISAKEDLARTFEQPTHGESTEFGSFVSDPGVLREDS